MSFFLAISYWLSAISYFHNNVFVVKMVDLPRSARKIGAG
jgi:hypothetical protein